VPLQFVAEKGDRKDDIEKNLQLDDQRRQTGRHAEFDGQKSNPNCATPIAGHSRRCRAKIRGRRMKNTNGTAAKKKRNAASANGRTSRNPTLSARTRIPTE
jgi:hypothetical protein